MPISVKIISYRKEIETAIDKDLLKRIRDVGILVENQAKENVNQTPPAHPQVQTSQLRSSINHQIESTNTSYTAIIGTPVRHGLYLELGTSHHPPYAWLLPAVEMKQNDIKEILGHKGFSVGVQTEYGSNIDNYD